MVLLREIQITTADTLTLNLSFKCMSKERDIIPETDRT